MGDIVGPCDGTRRRHAPPLAGKQLRHPRPVSAPARRRSPLPGSSSPGGVTNSDRQQPSQQQRRRRRPESASGSGGGRGGAGCWSRDRGGGGGGGGADGHENFECLQARLAKTVEGSSNFVDDIRRLRKAGGLHYDGNDGASAWGRTPRAAAESAGARVDGGAASGGDASLLGGAFDDRAGLSTGTGGVPSATFSPGPVCTAGEVEPLALAKELGIQTIVDRITRAIVHGGRATETVGGISGRRSAGRGAGVGPEQGAQGALEASLAVTVAKTEPYTGARHNEDHARPLSAPPPPSTQRQQQVQFAVTEPPGGAVARSFTSSPPRGGSAKRRGPPTEDVERLRRVVRETMSSPQLRSTSSSSTSLYGGIASAGGGDRCGTHPPQWSQKHEACLAEMKRKLRESGSPLLRAKDPAVLLGALLRRQGPLIRLLDEAVVSLEDTAEALDALVSVSTRLKIAGVSADALFTRAGVVKPGAVGSLGHAAAGTATGAGGGRSTKRSGGEASKARRCTIKRIHVEIHRVLGEVASFREFKIALSACVRGGGGGGGGGRRGGGRGSNSGGSGMEWITVDQLDHALRTCHLTRRALDPQGASHPPLTGKRVARFLEEMERSSGKTQPPVPAAIAAATATAAGTSQNAVNMLLLGNEHSQNPTGGALKRGVPAKQRRQGRRAKMARKRAGKWNDEDRDLAERELAAVVVERQKKFVEGYVLERRRYLHRRVSAQREGHGGFQREKVPFGQPRNKVTEAEKTEFSEAVARTKIVLKLLETKAATLSLPQPNGGGGTASGGIPSSTGKGNAGSEVKRRSVGARNGSENARLGRRRPASAAAAVATTTPTTTATATATATATTSNRNNSTLSPKKKLDGTSKRAAVNDDKNAKRNMKHVLRTSTEAYSDRVGHRGGGPARLYSNNNSSRAGGGAAAGGGASGGGIAAGGGGERGRMFAAAQTVQVAFRQRMFYRFVWAQAYLRSPVHAFGLFKRCLAVLRGADAATAPGPSDPPAPEGRPATRLVSSVDAWPELPGFCLSLPHHVHAADPVFLRYVRWRRRESAEGAYFGERIGSAPEATTPASADAAVGSLHPLLLTPAQESPPQPQKQQEPPPEGAQLFEKKHPVRAAAVRSMLVDLRVPFLPGALDSAMEDLEQTIAREGAGVNVVGGGGKSRPGADGRSDRDATGSAAARSKPPPGSASGIPGGGRLGQHGAGISFAEWYGWWVRHLPFDPASTGCLLKTVRCAKALHAAEISGAAWRL